ncbi:MAG: transglutaminase domain-containing protein, partial [Candidatus Hydrogenedentes bacterium]|nr:transglutaminase domain-containing protein [Candidatus Hydrogenedentota bacterium]
DDSGDIHVVQDARFQVNMVGTKQDMHIFTDRVYSAEGALKALNQEVVDIASTSRFQGKIVGDELVLASDVAGTAGEKRFPKPDESLEDALKYSLWVQGAPKIGDEISYTVFEPMLGREVTARSQIIDEEDRLFEGVNTHVYKVKTVIDVMNVDTVTYVTEKGTILEDVVAGMLTMRLEPEKIAKDVSYSNDTIISNAALIDEPIPNPRGRKDLRLILHGPIKGDHLFNDERQYFRAEDDHFVFESKQISLDDLEPVTVPVQHPDFQEWLAPTTFVQSDDPRMKAKAQEIIGDEKNALKVSEKLCHWVNEHVESTYSARLTNALEVLDSLEGDCTEHSILFIGLARAAGLPAREVAGLVYVEGPKPGFYFHQWAKVWVGKWIEVDPTFDQPIADVSRIKLAEGDLFAQAKIIPLIGHVQVALVKDGEGVAQSE